MPDNNHTVQCVVVTPERMFLNEAADFVVLPLDDGELGVLPEREALVSLLGPGELRLKSGEQVRRFFVDGGFACVRGDVVTVLTPEALKAEDITASDARACLDRSVGQPVSLEAQRRARALLRIATQRTSSASR